MLRVFPANQEGLLSIEQLRERMPMLRQREPRLRAELQAIADQTNDRAAFLRLAETLTAFLTRLRSAAQTLSVIERQKIVRLLIKDILVGEDTITIRHSVEKSFDTFGNMSQLPLQTLLTFSGWVRRARCYQRSDSIRCAEKRRIRVAGLKITFCVRGVSGPP